MPAEPDSPDPRPRIRIPLGHLRCDCPVYASDGIGYQQHAEHTAWCQRHNGTEAREAISTDWMRKEPDAPR